MSLALSPCSPMAIPETKSISSASITLSSAGRLVLGQDAFQAGIRHLDRGHCLVDQLADARLLGVWPEGATNAPPSAPRMFSARYSRVLGGCSNYVRHVGLVLAVTKATK